MKNHWLDRMLAHPMHPEHAARFGASLRYLQYPDDLSSVNRYFIICDF